MGNPFYIQEVPVGAPFCDREGELKELESYAVAKANVVIYSPRRYGKTSLVRRIQAGLAAKGAVTIFADFFGVASIDDAAARLAKAVFTVTHSKEPLWKTALRVIRSFRPILKPDPSGGVSLTVEPSSTGTSGIELLEETMDSLGEFIAVSGRLVHIALDEFQEIVTLKESLRVEAVMRTHIQRHQASYFFIGSRRRILLAIFNERQRPFFQSAVNYPLKPLPSAALKQFISLQFRENGKRCTEDTAGKLVSLVECHPYYSQKLAFFVYEAAVEVTDGAIKEGLDRLVSTERPVSMVIEKCTGFGH